MNESISIDNLLVIITTVITVALALYILMTILKNRGYNYKKNRAIIEDMRKHYESQIYHLNEKMIGTEIRFRDLNHLILNNKADDSTTYPSRVRMSNFIDSNGLTELDLIVKKNLIFVLTPFHPNFEDDYDTIKEICSEGDLICTRGDEEYFSSDIFPHILKKIVESRIIIANVSGRNPNVLYELGIAQAMDKPTILIAKSSIELPVDLKSKRFIIYSNQKELAILLQKELLKVLQ